MLNLFILFISLVGIGILYPFYKINRIETDWLVFIATILVCLNLVLLL